MLVAACRYVSNPEFDPSLVKNASKACEGICKWVRALDIYDRVIKIVAPKKIKLAEAEAELDVQMTNLNQKRAELKTVRSSEYSNNNNNNNDNKLKNNNNNNCYYYY